MASPVLGLYLEALRQADPLAFHRSAVSLVHHGANMLARFAALPLERKGYILGGRSDEAARDGTPGGGLRDSCRHRARLGDRFSEDDPEGFARPSVSSSEVSCNTSRSAGFTMTRMSRCCSTASSIQRRAVRLLPLSPCGRAGLALADCPASTQRRDAMSRWVVTANDPLRTGPPQGEGPGSPQRGLRCPRAWAARRAARASGVGGTPLPAWATTAHLGAVVQPEPVSLRPPCPSPRRRRGGG